jgi:ribonucleotide reductase alpha subunit
MTETVSGPGRHDAGGKRSGAKGKAPTGGLTIDRIFTTEGAHPYDEVSWERRDVVQQNWKTGATVFEQRGVEFPDFWSVNASTIVTSKYFRGALGTDVREWSLKQLVDRVVKTYRRAGEEYGYFASPKDAEIFEHELAWMLVHQVFSFNSPVWFNVGTPSPQQVSACQPYHALVSTPQGLIPIGELVDNDAVGMKVYDANGVTKVVATKANGVKDVLRLHTKAGYVLDATADHLVWRSSGQGSGTFVEAGTLKPGDALEWHDAGFSSPIQHPEIARIERLGSMEVYDIQTESGEYLSGGLRVHNCFILSVDDSMESILNWYREEGLIFKGGSGAGLNLSRIRSSKELLSSGGTASGPVSFMRGADASAGTIKSGGATRRAAKMVVLDVDHPDVEEFIETKAREENKIRALRDAGFDMDLGGQDIVSVQYQNANNSVRVSDEFMRAVEKDEKFGLRARLTGEVIETVDARELFRKMARAAWECADPGIQYDGTINDWHTNPETGRITASNPCCFTGDTLVQTTHGPMALDQVVKNVSAGEAVSVHAYDVSGGAFVDRPVVAGWVAGHTAYLIEVTTENGLRLRCTPEHRFLTAAGWVEAEALSAGVPLVSVGGEDAVSKAERVLLDDAIAVYDIEVSGVHNFVVAGDGMPGVVVHNSEYMSLDNSSCNLASLNLMKFLRDDDTFDADLFRRCVELIITAMDISISFADFPTEAITETTRAYRQLGIGYANLGALLMATGHGYDSDGGRAVAATITSLMTGAAYKRSAELAGVVGPYQGFARNAKAHARVMRKHAAANDAIRLVGGMDRSIHELATTAWAEGNKIGESNGWRNGQASLLAPTGTIGLMMDCDTTGVEPDLALVKFKKLVGGGSMQIVNQTVPRALRKLGYQDEQVEAIVEYIAEHGHVVDAPGLRTEHYEVFDCAMGERSIRPMGHVNMMAAIQPFLSGAISKCVVGDTLVASDDGLVRIGSLYQGEAEDTFRQERMQIVSLDGYRKTDAFYYGGVRPVRTVRLRSGHRITGTHPHRLLTAVEGGLEWKALGELGVGDAVATRYGSELWSTTPASLRHIGVSPPYGSQKKVELPPEMTAELALLLGAYVAEGHINRSNWTVVITNSVSSVLQRVQDAWRTVFGVEAQIVEQPGECPGVVVASKTIVEFLEALGCGSRASAKRIPDAVLRSPREMVLAFLQGLSLDAYVTTSTAPKWAICVDSPLLLDDLQAVMTNLGVRHGRVTKHNSSNGKDYDEVYAADRQGQLMAALVPFLEPDKSARAAVYLRQSYRSGTADVLPGITGPDLYEMIPVGKPGGDVRSWRSEFTFLRDPRTRQVTRETLERVSTLPGVELPAWLRQILDDDLHFSPVESVVDAGEAEVYDLSVPETHAFVANGIMNHNTVNVPESATVEDIEHIYFEGWKLGLKALAVYRDNCKVGQPLSDARGKKAAEAAEAGKEVVVEYRPIRKRLPKSRPSRTTSFTVGGAEGYITAGSYPDNGLGEVFLKLGKQGSTLAGVMDAFSIAISIALQYGVPLESYVQKFTNMRFEPSGMTDDPDVRMAQSVVDYIFRRLALDHLSFEERSALGIYTAAERTQQLDTGAYAPVEDEVDVEALRQSAPIEEPRPVANQPAAAKAAPAEAHTSTELLEILQGKSADAPLCVTCGTKMRPAGSCYVCEGCGSTSGCS